MRGACVSVELKLRLEVVALVYVESSFTGYATSCATSCSSVVSVVVVVMDVLDLSVFGI